MKNTLHFTFLRALMILVFSLFFNGVSGQTAQSVPYSMPASAGSSFLSSNNGWTSSGIGSDYSSSGSNIKFDTTGDVATLYLASSPGTLSFNLKGNGLSGSYIFTVLESVDNSQYSAALTITTGVGTSNTLFTVNLSPLSRYVRWVYTAKASGNIGFGGVVISQPANTPTLAISANPSLTESNLNGALVNVNLSNNTFVSGQPTTSSFVLNNAPAGVSISGVSNVTTTSATIALAYDNTDFDTSVANFSVKALASSLTSNADLTSGNLTITAVTETITNSPTTLASINYVEGSGPSTAKSFTVASSNLKTGPGNLTVTGSTNYEVSTTSATTGFGATATLPYTANGTFTSNTVYVRLKSGLTIGNYNSESITVIGGGASSTTTVSGSVTSPPPANDDCTGAITLVLNGAAVSGTTLNSNSSIASSPCNSSARNDVWYNFTTTDAGNYKITVTTSSSFDAVLDLRSGVCDGANVACMDDSGSGLTEVLTSALSANSTYLVRVFHFGSSVPASPTFTIKVESPQSSLTASESSLNFANTNITTFSASQTFNLSGVALTNSPGVITISAPNTDFQVSNDNATWGSTTTIAYSSSTLSNTLVYVRFAPQSPGAKSGNLTISGGGVANTPTVALTGTGIVGTPIATIATAINTNSFQANWNAVAGVTEYRLDVSTLSAFGTLQTIIEEGFEAATFPPTGWITSGFTRSTDSGDIKNGTASAIGGSNSGSLTTKVVANPSLMTFYLGRSSNTTAKTLDIEVSTTSQTSGFSTVATYTNSNVPVSSYDQYTVDLSAYSNNSTVYVRFTKSSSTTSPWRLDDIVIQSLIPSFVTGYENLLVSGTSQSVTGLTQGTNYHYRVRAVSGATTSANSNVIDVTTIATSTTWNGTSWTNGAPTATVDAIIAANYSTGAVAPQGTFTAKSLTVNSGATLTVATGTTLTVENAIVNNNPNGLGFIVEDNADLVQVTDATNTGDIKVLKKTTPIVRLDHTLWSSPVNGTQSLNNFSPNTLSNRFYTYNTASNAFVSVPQTDTFVTGIGYGIRADNNWGTTPLAWEGTFVGKPNNGTQTFTLSASTTIGYNLVGNPYPSSIDALAFVNTNSAKIERKLYFYSHSVTMQTDGTFLGNNYGIMTVNAAGTSQSYVPADNSSATSNGKIATGQGFFVKALPSATGTINFNNTMRTSAGLFYRSQEIAYEKHSVRLKLTNSEGLFSTLLVNYEGDGTQGVDESDAVAFGTPTFYSLIETGKYKIQGKSLPFINTDIVPLGFTAYVSGNHTIELNENSGLFSEQNIYLKDNVTGSIHDIKSGSYTFAANTGTYNNRFEIVYQNSLLGVDNPVFNQNSLVVFKKDGLLNVNATGTTISQIAIYDMSGRILYNNKNVDAENAVINDLVSGHQVLIVKVTSAENAVVTKKVIF